MSDFYQEVFPKEEHLYFRENMRDLIKTTLKQQIVATEKRNLAVGQGMFVLDELTTKERGKFHIAVHALWEYDIANKQFTRFEILKYYLYTGELPDQVLDHINKLQQQGPAEWKINETTEDHGLKK